MTPLLLAAVALAQEPAADISPRLRVDPLGTQHLDAVASLSFTFNVEVEGVLKASRAWTWRPADQQATLRTGDDAITFVPGKPANEAEEQADARFVNDLFWLMPQLHLHWAGPDLEVTDAGEVPLPIGDGTAEKVVMTYAPDSGGYTPGDAYDLFVDGNDRIVAWNYRKGAAAEPTLTTTFEKYVDVGPLSIATEHRSADGNFRMYFTDLAAE